MQARCRTSLRSEKEGVSPPSFTIAGEGKKVGCGRLRYDVYKQGGWMVRMVGKGGRAGGFYGCMDVCQPQAVSCSA